MNAGEIEVMQQKLRELEILAHASSIPMDFVIMAVRRQFYFAALERTRGNRCKAARDLKCHRNTVERAEKELKIDVQEIKRKANGSVYTRSIATAKGA